MAQNRPLKAFQDPWRLFDGIRESEVQLRNVATVDASYILHVDRDLIARSVQPMSRRRISISGGLSITRRNGLRFGKRRTGLIVCLSCRVSLSIVVAAPGV